MVRPILIILARDLLCSCFSTSKICITEHLGPPPHPHPSSGSSGSTSGSSNGSSGDSSTDDVSSDSSTSSSDGSNNHASSTWGTVKCWMGMKQSCSDEEINNQAQGGGDVVNIGDTYNGGGNDGTASANSGASVAGIIGMAVGGVVLVAAVAAFLVGKAVSTIVDTFGCLFLWFIFLPLFRLRFQLGRSLTYLYNFPYSYKICLFCSDGLMMMKALSMDLQGQLPSLQSLAKTSSLSTAPMLRETLPSQVDQLDII